MTDPRAEIGRDPDTDDPVELPLVELLRGRSFALGKSGSGKSNTANVVVEEILDAGRACLIVDVDGEYYGLKEEYELLHATGDDSGDLRVGPEHASKLAEISLKRNVPVILDVSGFLDADDADELVGRVARELFAKAKSAKTPFLLVVEEAHEYIPQQASPSRAGEQITRIAKRGRKHGLGVLGISQRPASVDKDVLTQANLLVWHRLTYDTDTSVVRQMYGSDYADAIQQFSDGEALVESDDWDAPRVIQWRRQRTYDAGAAPGLDDSGRPELQTVGSEIVESLQEAGDAARSKQEQIDRLEARVEDLREELSDKESEIERLEERHVIEDRVTDRLFRGLDDLGGFDLDLDLGESGSIRAEVLEVVERKQELERERERLRDELERERELREELEERVEELSEYRDRVEEHAELHSLHEDLRELVQDRYAGLFGAGSDARVERLTQRVEELEAERDELERQVDEEIGGVDELLAHDVVSGQIDAVASTGSYAASHYWDAVTTLASTEWVGIDGVEPYLDLSRSSVSDVLRELHDQGVLERRDGTEVEYRVDRESLEALIDANRRRERIESARGEDGGDGN